MSLRTLKRSFYVLQNNNLLSRMWTSFGEKIFKKMRERFLITHNVRVFVFQSLIQQLVRFYLMKIMIGFFWLSNMTWLTIFYWAGYVFQGENAETTVGREIDEELGLRVKSLTFNTCQYYERSNSLIINFAATVTGNVSPNHEIDDWDWFSIEETKTFNDNLRTSVW